MVLWDALSAFSRNSRLPLSSTMQTVTSTCRFWASASAAATIVLMAARFRYLLLGSSATAIPTSTQSMTVSSLSMGTDATSCICGFPDESVRRQDELSSPARHELHKRRD